MNDYKVTIVIQKTITLDIKAMKTYTAMRHGKKFFLANTHMITGRDIKEISATKQISPKK